MELNVEVDTGASVRLLNLDTYEEVKITEKEMLSKLRTCTGEIHNPKGEFELKF